MFLAAIDSPLSILHSPGYIFTKDLLEALSWLGI